MALIICVDCQKEISDAAIACPNCGRPTRVTPPTPPSAPTHLSSRAVNEKTVSLSLGVGILLMPYIFSWFTLKDGYSTNARTVSFLWLAIIVVFYLSNHRDGATTASRPNAQQAARIPTTVSPHDLAQAYEANEAAADAKYKGGLLLVSGTLNSIQKDFTNDTVLTLEAGTFLGVHASLNDSEVSKAINLHKGQNVTVLCIGGGEVIGTPMLRDCDIKGL